ncbi:PREDICTED: NHL-repeat-containing protein 4 [Apaloderma vittatum]|uniref:NHL-repeat-containing protein 4 n=1 Tax=Apaloderma vittatum TaxID=57397 RepID=UPI000521A379|nr:PREDICTED: NHL-repeat-containing protein 4 [Apaloderma vittatum]
MSSGHRLARAPRPITQAGAYCLWDKCWPFRKATSCSLGAVGFVMDYTLETSLQKEKLLKTIYTLQLKSSTTLQTASPLLSSQRGMGMVTQHQVHQLADKAKSLCGDLDNIKNLLHYCQDNLIRRIPNPTGSRYGGVSGIHCSLDGSIYVTAESAPWVHILSSTGQTLQSLPCQQTGKESGTFLPEDVTVTRTGMVAVADMMNGAIWVFNPHTSPSKGEWIKIRKVGSPTGIGVDSMGKILIADYAQGQVHRFALDRAFKTHNVHSVPNLQGPHYVSPAPNGGFVVSEECRDVKVFTSSCKLLCSLSSKYGHWFGNPAGVCVDRDGSILVADEQRRTVHLFPEHGAPICLVSTGLRRPAGVACSSFGHLFVADAGENCVKDFKYCVRAP